MHTLIVGNSRSGKTTLAKILAQSNSVKNASIVYDPNRSAGWPANAVKFSSPTLFFAHLERVQSSTIFIDEAKTLWDFDSEKADELVYRGRHKGFSIVLIAQRTRMVSPNGRNQCSRIFAFRQQHDDADTLAQEYHEGLIECRQAAIGHFLASDGYNLWIGHIDPTVPPRIVWDNSH